MESNWAAEHLQVIRTLMERSAVYRRALAPILLFAGTAGLLAAAAGLGMHLDSVRAFGALWLGTAVVGVAGAFLLARRQALKDVEPFWSPPTRRVTQALLPPLTAGLCLGAVLMLADEEDQFVLLLPIVWMLFYGCALHAAGFFMPRGMRWLGWGFILGAGAVLGLLFATEPEAGAPFAHGVMGVFFGLLQLAAGVYLQLTEAKAKATGS